MDYFDRVQRVIDHIEIHLSDELTLTELSTISCYSPYHFHRVFLILTGINVMEYIRNRRLAKSLEEIENTDKTILEISLSYRFNSCDTFTRAFRRKYGMNPGTYRKTREMKAKPQDKINLMDNLNINNYRSFFMEPKIIEKGQFLFAGFELKTSSVEGKNYKEIPEFWKSYIKNNLKEKIKNKSDENIEIAVCCDFDPDTQNFSYVIGFEVDSFDGLPGDIFQREIPGAKYAVFTTPKSTPANFSESIQKTASFVFKEWLPESGYEYDDRCVDFEWYDRRMLNDDQCRMEIYVPVK